VYDRNVNNQELTFEASGGLINSSLVLQDRETDSYWPIMRGDAVEGALKGTQLRELAINKKMKWKDWRRKHPDTLVLSVSGREDAAPGYEQYFQSSEGFRGSHAQDARLDTKQSIFAFRWRGDSYAAAFSSFAGGSTWNLGGQHVFLFRDHAAHLHASTAAYVATSAFVEENGAWQATGADCAFNPQTQAFEGSGGCPEMLPGFDTFWYNWSLNNPNTELLE
jgi:hypothetical protein